MSPTETKGTVTGPVAEPLFKGRPKVTLEDAAGDWLCSSCLNRVANEKDMTLADALSADPRVSAHIDRAAIDRLTSPKNYLGLAPEMVDRVLAASKR